MVLAAEGRHSTFSNVATGTVIDPAELVSLASHYTRDFLATFTLRHCVSLFEVFLFRFMHRLLTHNPRQFAEKQLDFRIVLDAATRDDIIAVMLHKQLNELKYEQLREWFLAINKAVRLDCPTPDEIDALAEIKAARDILEHNDGVANDVYLRKASRKARFALGETVEIDNVYLLESWQLIRKVVADLSAAAVARLT